MINLASQIDVIATAALDAGIPFAEAMDLIDARFVVVAMARAEGNVSQAARILNIHRNSVHTRLRKAKRG